MDSPCYSARNSSNSSNRMDKRASVVRAGRGLLYRHDVRVLRRRVHKVGDYPFPSLRVRERVAGTLPGITKRIRVK